MAAKLRAIAIAWAAGFTILSVILGYGIAEQDWRVTRYAFLAMIGFNPVMAVGAYMETRAAWSGEDTSSLQSVIALCIIAAVFALSYVI